MLEIKSFPKEFLLKVKEKAKRFKKQEKRALEDRVLIKEKKKVFQNNQNEKFEGESDKLKEELQKNESLTKEQEKKH